MRCCSMASGRSQRRHRKRRASRPRANVCRRNTRCAFYIYVHMYRWYIITPRCVCVGKYTKRDVFFLNRTYYVQWIIVQPNLFGNEKCHWCICVPYLRVNSVLCCCCFYKNIITIAAISISLLLSSWFTHDVIAHVGHYYLELVGNTIIIMLDLMYN